MQLRLYSIELVMESFLRFSAFFSFNPNFLT